MDTIFPKEKPVATHIESGSDESFESDSDENSEASDADSSDSNDESDDDQTVRTVEICHKFKGTLEKMRKLVLLFKNSPVLQKIIKRTTGSPLQLKLDSKTRWNSLVESSIRFLRVIEQVEEALAHRTIKKTGYWLQGDTEILKVIS